MAFHRIGIFMISLIGATLGCFVFAPRAQAQLFYDAEVKAIYEDNVIGLLTDKRGGKAGGGAPGSPMTALTAPAQLALMGPRPARDTGSQPKGDFSVNLFADLGGSKDVFRDTSLFIIGSAQHTSYATFTQFDSTIGTLGVGMKKELSDAVSLRIVGFGSVKRFEDSPRDSTSYGGRVALREQLSQKFSLKEIYEYEKNSADSPLFTYVGNSISIWAGFDATPRTRLYLGYNFLKRDYDEPSGFTATADTISLALESEFSKRWYFDAGYDHVIGRSNEPSATATDNVISVGLRYSY